jgi:flagellin-like protein
MRKLLKSKKALSPVVAAIILIAVTVAVSIAVAAWMGSLTIGFMETSEVTVTQMTFAGTSGAADNTIVVSLTNSGTSDVTISLVKLNSVTATSSDTPLQIAAGDPDTLTITAAGWTAGNKYSINMFATDGTLVGSFTDTA